MSTFPQFEPFIFSLTKSVELMHINCDMGEGYGRYTLHDDKEIMPYVNACNIACGYHAGDATTIRRTIEWALEYSVEIGCHPSYPDQQGFGRRYMQIPTSDLTDMICHQIGAVISMTTMLGGQVTHIKPHGALYNSAAHSIDDAIAVVEGILLVDKNLTLYTLPKGRLHLLAIENDIKVKTEGFIDRRYDFSGKLTSRSQKDSVITDPLVAASQAYQIWNHKKVVSITGEEVDMKVETLCIHGDNPNAINILNELHKSN